VVNLFVPGLRGRRWVAGLSARWFLRGAGIRLGVEGRERLPQGPCVVVANHASYIDGIVAAAALPPDFAFVIKKEMVRVPLASLLLRRLGSAFVFFPEGTFDGTRQVGKFLGGAFATAERSNMPIVAVAIHGTREVLPPGTMGVRRSAVRFEILGVLQADGARQRSREWIAEALGEPLA
jgi:1-acyl-sn-glycerol-3-phosphate acyltransferase